MKTARFTDLVRQSGAPEPHSLWMAPRGDPAFQRALKQHRVLTVHQQTGSAKKDFGEVGFHEKPGAQYLLFPRSIERFADRHVVGINYDLLAAGSQPVAAKPPRKQTPRAATSRGPSKPGARPGTVPRTSLLPANSAPAANGRRHTAHQAPAMRKPSRDAAVHGGIARQNATVKLIGAASRRPVGASRGAKARGRTASVATTPGQTSAADRRLQDEIKCAMKELKSGKTVAAYERLARLAGPPTA